MLGLELLFLGVIGGAVAAVTADDSSSNKGKKKEKDDTTGCGHSFGLSNSPAFNVDDVLSRYRRPTTSFSPSSLLSVPVLPTLSAPEPVRPKLYEPIEPLRPRLLPDPVPFRPTFEISSHSTSYDAEHHFGIGGAR